MILPFRQGLTHSETLETDIEMTCIEDLPLPPPPESIPPLTLTDRSQFGGNSSHYDSPIYHQLKTPPEPRQKLPTVTFSNHDIVDIITSMEPQPTTKLYDEGNSRVTSAQICRQLCCVLCYVPPKYSKEGYKQESEMTIAYRLVCARVAVIVANIFVALSGLTMIGCGLWLTLDTDGLRQVVHAIRSHDLVENIHFASWGLVLGGCVVFSFAFIGCAGAGCMNQCLLYSYFIIIGALFLSQITALVFMMTYANKIPQALTSAFERMEISRPHEFDRVKHVEQCWHPRHCSFLIVERLNEQKLLFMAISVVILATELLTLFVTCVLSSSLRRRGYDRYVAV